MSLQVMGCLFYLFDVVLINSLFDNIHLLRQVHKDNVDHFSQLVKVVFSMNQHQRLIKYSGLRGLLLVDAEGTNGFLQALKRDLYIKGAAVVQFAFNGNGALHQFAQLSRNGQPKPRAAIFARG